ncbi:uncharacterized protein BX664DRAFT_270576 [Halteromyces radiatus]|uniref:uncharacterized protein n=1 Tax=Halteromyces radiatus TaxID=101107 RepID=UPI002220B2D8|nr:uncharacterized protein BX664DRAFT_270576 [Halteromyces radiatus]KAI8077855.1 hypothetical protein BX664DRAFT_270576 [Halteromyces radiatus]
MDNVTITGIHEILRTYQKITSSQPIHWRTHKRAVITRYSLDYISSSYRENQYCPPPPTDPSAYEKEMFIVELSHLHTIYERIVYSLVSFPHSGDSNPMIYEMVDRLADDMELIDDSPVELRNYIEMLNRATQRTFNSSRITRHLFHALVRLGDFKEAEHALTSYLYLVGLQSQVTRETKDWGDAITIDKHGRASTIPFMNESLLKQLAEDALSESMLYTDKRYDHESVESIVNVLIAGVRMYCKYLRKGTEAVELAELAKIVLEVTGANNIIGSRLGGIVYRYLGVAYGLMASDTTDPEIRPTYHELAKKYLQQSITLDDKAWETHYQLAKQLAEMRDITDAFQSVAKSLEINPNHLPSWHLLVLLYSCPKQDDVFKALKVCELGLDEAKSLQLEWADDSEGYEQQLLLKLTHMLLVEIAQGTEAALVCQEEVFSMYGKLTMMDPEMTSSGSDTDGGVGGSDSFTSRRELVVSGSLGNICDTGNTTNNLSQPTGGEASLTVPTEQPVSSSSNGITTINSSLSSTSMQQPLKSTVNATRTSDPSGQSSMPSEKTNSHQNISNGRKALVGYPVSLSKKESLTSFHSVSTSLPSNQSIFQSTIPRKPQWTKLRRHQIQHILCLLWMTSAGTFLRQGRLDEALKAVEEAEKVNWTSEPHVWCLLGQVRLGQSRQEEAIEAFQKGLVADPNDTLCRLWLAKTFMEMGDLVVSEGILNNLTRGKGWNHPEAWYHLGDLYNKTNRMERAKNCLFYALELEDTEPIQPFSILPRCI